MIDPSQRFPRVPLLTLALVLPLEAAHCMWMRAPAGGPAKSHGCAPPA